MLPLPLFIINTSMWYIKNKIFHHAEDVNIYIYFLNYLA